MTNFFDQRKAEATLAEYLTLSLLLNHQVVNSWLAIEQSVTQNESAAAAPVWLRFARGRGLSDNVNFFDAIVAASSAFS